MIDDEVDVDLGQVGDEVTDNAAGRIELQMPTQRPCLADAAFDVSNDILQGPLSAQEEIETERPHTNAVHLQQLVIAEVFLDHRDTAAARTKLIERVEHAAVVRPVKA